MEALIHVFHPERAPFDGADGLEVWTDVEELNARIGEIEVLLVSQPPRGIWARASKLRLLHLAGVGAEALLPAPDLAAHVRVAGARGLFADEAAEHVIATMLALLRGLPRL